MGRERIEYLDLAKGICICIVMLFHTKGLLQCEFFIDPVLFSSYMLPPFFFLSGVFFKEEDSFGTFLKKKTNRLLIPFAFFYIVSAVIMPNFLHYIMGVEIKSVIGWKSLLAFVWPGVYPNFPLWFIWCLFLMNLLFWAINHLCNRIFRRHSRAMVACACICCALLATCYEQLFSVDVACIYNTLKYILFFCAGFLVSGIIKGHCLDTFSNLKKTGLLLITLAVTLVRLIPCVTASVLLETLSFYICGLAGSVFVIIVSSMIMYLPLVSYLGRYSIIIVLTHGLLIRAGTVFIAYLSSVIGTYNAVLLFWVLMALSYLIFIPIIRWCMPHVTAQKPLLK